MSIETSRQNLQQLAARIETLLNRCQASFEIQHSLPLLQAHEALSTYTDYAQSLLALFPNDDAGLEARLPILRRFLDSFSLPTIKGMAHDARQVTHYCVTADKSNGYGIYSAHANKEDARFNAALTGGKTAAVDRNDDGQIIEPAALREARRLQSEYC